MCLQITIISLLICALYWATVSATVDAKKNVTLTVVLFKKQII